MNMLDTESITSKKIKKNWLLVDAEGLTLGRVASEVAKRLMGKHKSSFTKHMDDGDYVVIVNAEKIHMTGDKWNQKMYHKHTGYIGHLKSVNYASLREKKPHFILEKAIKGMLPKNRLGSKQYSHLFVYAGPTHKHEAQNPTKLDFSK